MMFKFPAKILRHVSPSLIGSEGAWAAIRVAGRIMGFACLLGVTGCQSPGSSISTRPTRIVIIRHAEKPDDERNPHLSERGRLHALEWAKLISSPSGPLGGKVPAALFAPHPTEKRISIRPIETLQPLAEKSGQPVLTPFSAAEVGKLADKVRMDYGGQDVVICWVHEFLPDLARALGVIAVPQWKGKDYDSIWEIEFPAGRAELRIFPATSTSTAAAAKESP